MAFDLREIARKVRAAGRAMGPEGFATMALYTHFHEKEPYKNVKLERDLSYGPDERNRLDVFSAPDAKPNDNRDVIIFVHGGGFVQGDRHTPGSPYNDNVPLWAMRNGLVGVNMTYRLAPKHQWPSGIEDIAGRRRLDEEEHQSARRQSRTHLRLRRLGRRDACRHVYLALASCRRPADRRRHSQNPASTTSRSRQPASRPMSARPAIWARAIKPSSAERHQSKLSSRPSCHAFMYHANTIRRLFEAAHSPLIEDYQKSKATGRTSCA